MKHQKTSETPKLAERLSVPQVTFCTSFKGKNQRLRTPGRLMPRPIISHTFGTGRLTNFKLGIRMEYNDSQSRINDMGVTSKAIAHT